MRWSSVYRDENEAKPVPFLESVVENGPTAKDVEKDVERISVRLSSDKRMWIGIIADYYANKGIRYSHSKIMSLVVKCGYLRFDRAVTDSTRVLRKLIDVNFQNYSRSRSSDMSPRDYDGSLGGILGRQRKGERAVSVYMFKWVKDAIAKIGRMCNTTTVSYVVELVVSEALSSSTDVIDSNSREVYIEQMADFDEWLAKNAVYEINVARRADSISNIPFNRTRGSMDYLLGRCNETGGRIQFPVAEFYRFEGV